MRTMDEKRINIISAGKTESESRFCCPNEDLVDLVLSFND